MWTDLQTSLYDLWVDERVRAGLVLVGSILLAYVIELGMGRVVAVAASKTRTDLDDRIVAVIRRPTFWTVILIGLWQAVERLVEHQERSSSWNPAALVDQARAGNWDTETFVLYGIIRTTVVVLWSVAAVRVLETTLLAVSTRASEGAIIQQRTLPVFNMVIKIVIIGAAAYFIFLSWDINLSAWLASAGIVGIAIGFAARDSLANLFAGLFLIADNIYKVGDFIVLNNDPGLRGRVTRIGMRSTRILTLDHVEINVPNSLVGNATVVNEVGGPSPQQRLRIKVSVAYGSDVDRVFEVLATCAIGVAGVSAEPIPQAQFTAFGASGLDFELLAWIENPAERNAIVSRLNTQIYKALGAANIEIPYDKHDVYIKEMPGEMPGGRSPPDGRGDDSGHQDD